MRPLHLIVFLTYMLLGSFAFAQDATSISIRGKTFHIGDTADEVFQTIKPTDSKRKDITPDPRNPLSLSVTHHYEIDGKVFSMTFTRRGDSGPYRLERISSATSSKASPKTTGTAIRISEKQILEARPKYKIEVLSFDTSKNYGTANPYEAADYVRLRITNGSSIVLPVLTVRTNRYSKGEEVSWSRAPAISVEDLRPGQSKEVNYYPKGRLHNLIASVDRITVEIEKKIAPDEKQFFKEFER